MTSGSADPKILKSEKSFALQSLSTGESVPHFTDWGNAQWLCGREDGDIRYCHLWGRWMYWDGRRWAIDETGEIERRAKETVQSMYLLASMEDDSKTRKAIADHARKSEADSKILAMIRSATSEPGIPIKPKELDTDPMLLTVMNGSLDLKTGELHPHHRDNLITKIIPVAYDPAAKCAGWIAFLARIMNDSEPLMSFLQRSIGYSLTGDVSEQCLFLLHGLGSNGKTTLLSVLQALMGDYAKQARFESFLIRDHGGIPNDIAGLDGARLVTAAEAGQGRRLDEGLIKQLTGQDRVAARFLHQEFFEFVPQFKLWLAANHKPRIIGTDLAIWRRIKLIPFNITIAEEERDPKLPERLKEELSGILNWALEGCRAWQKAGLGTPEEVKAATGQYREEMDGLGEFIEERCTLRPDLRTTPAALYRAYTEWAQANGENPRSMLSKRTFGLCLSERGLLPGKSGSFRYWSGIALDGADGK